jgi:hypothetical protein
LDCGTPTKVQSYAKSFPGTIGEREGIAMDGNAFGRNGKVDLKIVGCLAAGGVVLVLCAGGIGGGIFWKIHSDEAAAQAERKQIIDALSPEVPKYLERTPPQPPLATGKFKGKVVCIDLGAKQIDEDSLNHLPAALKATKPEEVGAVVWLEWRVEDGGIYPDGSKAKIHVVVITLIDHANRAILFAKKEIRGETAATKIGSGDRVGPKPWDKIITFLQQYSESS